MADSGTTAQKIALDIPEWMAISAFTALAWYNVLQLNVSIFLTFKRRRGLYFWSLLISGWGVIFHSTGFLLKLFALTQPSYISIGIITIGWWSMVTGQSLVLYSRLHLVVKDQRILRGVLIMIIWNAITLHIPTTILTFGCNSPDYQRYVPIFNVYERVQMTIFSVQELVISSIYLWAAFRLLKPIYRQRIRSVMMQLLWVNLIMVGMDVSILVMEYMGYYPIEATLKSMIYAIKLVLEFAVLNQLMRLANSSRTNRELQKLNDEPGMDGGEPHERRRSRWGSLTKPTRAFFHDRTSISTRTDSEPARIGSIAKRNESVGESQHDFSALSGPKDKQRHFNVPDLIIDPGNKEWTFDGSPTTIVNNPAAFSPEHRKHPDPFSLEGLSPTASEFEFHRHPMPSAKTAVETPIDAGNHLGVHEMADNHLSNITDAPDIEAEAEARAHRTKSPAADGELFRSRRASVSDFTYDGNTSEDYETDPAEMTTAQKKALNRHSAALSARGDNVTPSWLAVEELAAASDPKRLSAPPRADATGSKRSSAGGASFASKALQSVYRRSQHLHSPSPSPSPLPTNRNDSVTTEFGRTGVRHSLPE